MFNRKAGRSGQQIGKVERVERIPFGRALYAGEIVIGVLYIFSSKFKRILAHGGSTVYMFNPFHFYDIWRWCLRLRLNIVFNRRSTCSTAWHR